MCRLISTLAGTLLLTGVLLAAPQAPKQEAGIHCTLTKRNIKKCCCEPRGEKLYCKLAKKTIEKYCCESAQFPKQKKN